MASSIIQCSSDAANWGIRIAIVASAVDIATRVGADVAWMVCIGLASGAGIGLFLEQYIKTLLYQIKIFDPAILMVPVTIILAAGLLAALPALIRAIRIDPAAMLRVE